MQPVIGQDFYCLFYDHTFNYSLKEAAGQVAGFPAKKRKRSRLPGSENLGHSPHAVIF
jgi:hypothetical protein